MWASSKTITLKTRLPLCTCSSVWICLSFSWIASRSHSSSCCLSAAVSDRKLTLEEATTLAMRVAPHTSYGTFRPCLAGRGH